MYPKPPIPIEPATYRMALTKPVAILDSPKSFTLGHEICGSVVRATGPKYTRANASTFRSQTRAKGEILDGC